MEEAKECRKAAEAEECWKVAEACCKVEVVVVKAHLRVEEKVKHKAAKKAAKKRVNASTFPNKWC